MEAHQSLPGLKLSRLMDSHMATQCHRPWYVCACPRTHTHTHTQHDFVFSIELQQSLVWIPQVLPIFQIVQTY